MQLNSENESYRAIYTGLEMILKERQQRCINHLEQLENLQELDYETENASASQETCQPHSGKTRSISFSKALPQKSGNFSSTSDRSCSYQQLLDSQLELYTETDMMIENLKNSLIFCEEKERRNERLHLQVDDVVCSRAEYTEIDQHIGEQEEEESKLDH